MMKFHAKLIPGTKLLYMVNIIRILKKLAWLLKHKKKPLKGHNDFFFVQNINDSVFHLRT